MEPETTAQAGFDDGVSAASRRFTSRAELDAFVERWLPRVYRFAERRTPSRWHAERVARAVLAAALGEGLGCAGADAAPRFLALTKAELGRVRAGLA